MAAAASTKVADLIAAGTAATAEAFTKEEWLLIVAARYSGGLSGGGQG